LLMSGDKIYVVAGRDCYTLVVPKDTGRDSRAVQFETAISFPDKDGAPGAIPLEILPDRPLGWREYKALTERARHLNGLWDRDSTYHWVLNRILPWRPMDNPAKRLNSAQREERDALNNAMFATFNPAPTPVEAKFEAQAASPIGSTAAVIGGEATERLIGKEYRGIGETVSFAAGAVVDSLARKTPAGRGMSVAAMRRPARPPRAAGSEIYNAWRRARTRRLKEQTLVFAADPEADPKLLKEANGLMRAYLKSGDETYLQRLEEMARSEQRLEQMTEGELHPVQVAHNKQSIRMQVEDFVERGRWFDDYARRLSRLRVKRSTHEVNRRVIEERLEKLRGYISMLKRWPQAQATLRDYFVVTSPANPNDERIIKVQEALLQDPYNTHRALNGSGVKRIEFLLGPPPLNSVGSKRHRLYGPYRNPLGTGLSPDGSVLYIDVSTGSPTLIARRINKFLENIPRP
jgi:hypothetical protein